MASSQGLSAIARLANRRGATPRPAADVATTNFRTGQTNVPSQREAGMATIDPSRIGQGGVAESATTRNTGRPIRKARADGTAGAAPAAPTFGRQDAQQLGATASMQPQTSPMTTGKAQPGAKLLTGADRAALQTSRGTPPPAPGVTPTVSQQAGAATQANQATFDPALANTTANQILSDMKTPGLFQGGLRRENKRETALIKAAQVGGITADEWTQLQKDLGGQKIGDFFQGAKSQQSGALSTMSTAFPSLARPQGTPLEQMMNYPTATETVGPGVEGAQVQGDIQAEEEKTSAESIKAGAQGITREISGALKQGNAAINTAERTAGTNLDTVHAQGQAVLAQANATPAKVATTFNNAIAGFDAKVTAAGGIIDAKETAALAEVGRGQSAAMQSAVQGIQGNVNNAVAQIQANPNLTDAQKQQMIAQTRMQGAGQMAPAVGQTILGFTTLAANTATAFGQMATSIQQTGLSVGGQLRGAGAQAYAASSDAANQIGANILATRASADSSYTSAVANLENTRSTLEMAGETLKSQLLPVASGIPYADHLSVDLMGIEMANGLWKQDAAQLGATGMLDLMKDWAKSSKDLAAFNAISTIGVALKG